MGYIVIVIRASTRLFLLFEEWSQLLRRNRAALHII